MTKTKNTPNTAKDWAPANPDRWPAGCTPTRDGWVRWYRGKTRFVCGRKTPLVEVEDNWIELKKLIDDSAGHAFVRRIGVIDFREGVMLFLTQLKSRIGAEHRSIEDRTYHNYVAELNRFGRFVCEGEKIGDKIIDEIGPREFSAFSRSLSHWKASGFDSTVSRISAFFDWCVQMHYLKSWSRGPDFIRPEKQEIRDQRIDRIRALTAVEIARSFLSANLTIRCWIVLGICAAFVNSDVAHMTRSVIDLNTGVIDFRRRKTGKVRRVIPLPKEAIDLLREYVRPLPAAEEYADLFFLTEGGIPYSRTIGSGPSCSISSLFGQLLVDAGMKTYGRNFAGLRTSFFNLAPRTAEYETERKIIMGRAKGTIDLDHYLEDVGLDRLRHVTSYVWDQVKTEIQLRKQVRTSLPEAAPLQ